MSLGDDLKVKFGGQPAYVWGGGLVAVILAYAYYKHRQAAAAAAAAPVVATTDNAANVAGDGSLANGVANGGATDGNGFPLTQTNQGPVGPQGPAGPAGPTGPAAPVPPRVVSPPPVVRHSNVATMYAVNSNRLNHKIAPLTVAQYLAAYPGGTVQNGAQTLYINARARQPGAIVKPPVKPAPKPATATKAATVLPHTVQPVAVVSSPHDMQAHAPVSLSTK